LIENDELTRSEVGYYANVFNVKSESASQVVFGNIPLCMKRLFLVGSWNCSVYKLNLIASLPC